MLKWFFAFLFGTLFAISVGLYFRLGVYKEVTLEVQDNYPELKVVYREHLGAYHKINAVIESVEAWMKEVSLPCPQTFGEYFDEPGTIEEERQRSIGGCVVTTEQDHLPDKILFKTIPAGKYLIAKFKGSPSIGPFIVYPKIDKWFSDNNTVKPKTVIEIYDISGSQVTTSYLFKIDSH